MPCSCGHIACLIEGHSRPIARLCNTARKVCPFLAMAGTWLSGIIWRQILEQTIYKAPKA
jgi:hypothetical protein